MQHRSRHVLDINRINRSSHPQRGAEEAAQNAALACDEAWFGNADFNALVFGGEFVDCGCCFALCRSDNYRWGNRINRVEDTYAHLGVLDHRRRHPHFSVFAMRIRWICSRSAAHV